MFGFDACLQNAFTHGHSPADKQVIRSAIEGKGKVKRCFAGQIID